MEKFLWTVVKTYHLFFENEKDIFYVCGIAHRYVGICPGGPLE